jgi:anti-sigma-K factor RskA
LAPDVTMNGHLQFEDDFELYALGALDGEDKATVEAHLAGCAECRTKLESARTRMALLGLAAPSAAPAARVRERVLQEFRAHRVGGPSAAVTPIRARRSPWAPLWALAAVVLVAAAGWLRFENGRLSRELEELETEHEQLVQDNRQFAAETARAQAALEVLTAPETVKVELTAAAARPVPHGKAFYNSSKGLIFYATNLAPLSAGRTYELWLIPSEGAPIGAGLFNSDSRGNGEVVLPTLPQGLTAKAFAVTVEPAGGVPAPTGPKVLIGPAS